MQLAVVVILAPELVCDFCLVDDLGLGCAEPDIDRGVPWYSAGEASPVEGYLSGPSKRARERCDPLDRERVYEGDVEWWVGPYKVLPVD